MVAPNARNGRWDFTGGDNEYLRQVGAAIPCADPTRVYASGFDGIGDDVCAGMRP